MKKIYLPFLTSFLLLSTTISFAQTDWKDVAPIFFARCTSCHHPGGNPQAQYTTYSSTIPWLTPMTTYLTSGYMPPWSPDTNYTRFSHERIISVSEKNAILNWISGGALQGDTTLAPPIPLYPQYQLYGTPDQIVQIPTFTSNAYTQDSYVCFAVPSNLTQDMYLRAYEIVPGNVSIVHHVVVNVDTTGTVTSDLSGACYSEPGQFSIGGFAPGAGPTIFPNSSLIKAGIRIKAGSKIIMQIHYPLGTGGMVDSTKIRMYYYPVATTGIRPIYVTVPLQNWTLFIQPNTTATYTAKYPSGNQTLPLALSMYSTFPHSHKICTSITNYAYTAIDTIPLIRINNWNFDWQGYYTYRNLVKVPAGYKLWSTHFFDNTTANPNNPSPALVVAGTSTTDEMLFDGFQYLLYQNGDEFINIDSILTIDPLLNGVQGPQSPPSLSTFAFPNPFSETVNISCTLENTSDVMVSVYDMRGALVKQIYKGSQPAGAFTTEWNGTNEAGVKLSGGMYYYNITAGNVSSGGKLMLLPKK